MPRETASALLIAAVVVAVRLQCKEVGYDPVDGVNLVLVRHKNVDAVVREAAGADGSDAGAYARPPTWLRGSQE